MIVSKKEIQVPANEPEERFLLGTVEFEAISPDTLRIRPELKPRAVWRAHVDDPYVNAYPSQVLLEVRAHEREIDSIARERRLMGHWERRPGTTYISGATELAKEAGVWGDPVASSRYFEALDSPASDAWHGLIPSAFALLYVADPFGFDHVQFSGGSVIADDTVRLQLSLCIDAVGIRSRASVMASLVRAILHEPNQARGSRETQARWMSIACGTALPAIKAAVQAEFDGDLLLIDIDGKALARVKTLASEVGFFGAVTTHRMNIFNPRRMEVLADELRASGNQPNLIDLMGIFEYTGANIGVDPSQFLRSAYDCLAAGGTLILGQMRADRPMPDFLTGVLRWPYIEMRTIDQLMQLVAGAGIKPESVDLYLPADGIYAIGVIRKREP